MLTKCIYPFAAATSLALVMLYPVDISYAQNVMPVRPTAASSTQRPPVVAKLFTSDVRVDASGLETDTFHLEEQATNTAAAQDMGQQPITYSEAMYDVDVTEAYTLKSDGRRLPVASSAIYSQLPPGASQTPMFDDQRQKTIVFPDVEAGDTIIFTYKMRAKQTLMPGQYFSRLVFDRTYAYDDASGSLVIPKSLPLEVEVHDIDLKKEDTGQTITYHWQYASPQPSPNDTAVLSKFDHSPRLLLSSLKDYDAFARDYAALVAPKLTVTQVIQARADEITSGVSDHRQQAQKIYEWVSQHIRYVALEFGTGAIIPHDADTVLANGYGDCKDHVALFSALLKAKGINSEMVLINYGNEYNLPAVPIISGLNHVITWIPELQLYADTTAGVAPFGVLPFAEYGKPVVHVVSSGKALRHTPVLPPDTASVTVSAAAHIDSEGKIVGQTTTTAEGPFAITLRQVGDIFQAGGTARTAAAFLANTGTPGTADFNIPPPSELAPAYAIGANFSIGPFPDVMSGQRLAMPSKFDMLGGTGDTLIGPLGDINVKDSDPTPCYSGHAVEDVTLDPPTGRHFLNPPPDASVKTANLSFVARWSLTGQTIAVHREVNARFDTALCSGSTRIDAAKALSAIRDNYRLGVALAPP